jgi:hypothetical protein
LSSRLLMLLMLKVATLTSPFPWFIGRRRDRPDGLICE